MGRIVSKGEWLYGTNSPMGRMVSRGDISWCEVSWHFTKESNLNQVLQVLQGNSVNNFVMQHCYNSAISPEQRWPVCCGLDPVRQASCPVPFPVPIDTCPAVPCPAVRTGSCPVPTDGVGSVHRLQGIEHGWRYRISQTGYIRELKVVLWI